MVHWRPTTGATIRVHSHRGPPCVGALRRETCCGDRRSRTSGASSIGAGNSRDNPRHGWDTSAERPVGHCACCSAGRRRQTPQLGTCEHDVSGEKRPAGRVARIGVRPHRVDKNVPRVRRVGVGQAEPHLRACGAMLMWWAPQVLYRIERCDSVLRLLCVIAVPSCNFCLCDHSDVHRIAVPHCRWSARTHLGRRSQMETHASCEHDLRGIRAHRWANVSASG